jgi:hypothetical protein
MGRVALPAEAREVRAFPADAAFDAAREEEVSLGGAVVGAAELGK